MAQLPRTHQPVGVVRVNTAHRAGQSAASAANAARQPLPHMQVASAPCRAAIPTDRWALTLAGLRGERWPMPADIPGRVVQARDEPLAPEFLADVTSPTELALLLSISRQGAAHRLKKRGAETAHKDMT